jgi:HTH-type transcriptional regulator/antitoxin HipB
MQKLIRTPKQLGNVIRNARKKAGLTQSELSQKAGTRQETISLIENGNPATRCDTLLHVIATLDLDIEAVPRRRSQDTDFEEFL